MGGWIIGSIFLTLLFFLHSVSNGEFVNHAYFELSIAYFLGVYCFDRIKLGNNLQIIFAIGLAIMWNADMHVFKSNGLFMTIYNLICGLAFFNVALSVSIYISQFRCVRFMTKFFASSSMCAYLFHRQIYLFLNLLLGKFSCGTAYFIALPICIGISYVLQKIYDYVAEKSAKLIKTMC